MNTGFQRGSSMIQVYGDILDEETRCQHYHSERDIIALKCFACQKYYPCFLCHDRYEDHAFLAYPVSRSEDRVVLCGHCRTELTISQYLGCEDTCLICTHPFNPGCKKHRSIYFQTNK